MQALASERELLHASTQQRACRCYAAQPAHRATQTCLGELCARVLLAAARAAPLLPAVPREARPVAHASLQEPAPRDSRTPHVSRLGVPPTAHALHGVGAGAGAGFARLVQPAGIQLPGAQPALELPPPAGGSRVGKHPPR